MFRGCLGVLALLSAQTLALAQSAPAVLPAQLPDSAAQPPEKGKDTGQETEPKAEPIPAPQSRSDHAPAAWGDTSRGSLRLTHRGPEEMVWFRGGFLLWWVEDAPAPGPLVTTGPVASGGVLGSPGTQVLFGTERFDFGTAPGITLEGGVWLDECHQWGLGLSGFILERQGQGQLFSSDGTGSPLLARPFINAITGDPTRDTISAPGVAAGSVAVASSMQLAGAGAVLLRNVAHSETWDVRLSAGFRYLDLAEELNIFSTSTVLADPSGARTPGLRTTIGDRFATRNQLYLGQVGARFEWSSGPLFVGLDAKLGLGPNHQRVLIEGSTVRSAPGTGPVVSAGGLLAVPGTAALPGGNQGAHTTNWFVVVPEVGLDVGVELSKYLRVSAGYSFLSINSVARPGSQVNPVVNPGLVPSSVPFPAVPSGPGQPSVLTKQDDFWAHGVRFTVEFRF